MSVRMQEMQQKLAQAVETGEMLPERMELEIERETKMNETQLQNAQQQLMAEAQKAAYVDAACRVRLHVFRLWLFHGGL